MQLDPKMRSIGSKIHVWLLKAIELGHKLRLHKGLCKGYYYYYCYYYY
jgi:hypothetical protein